MTVAAVLGQQIVVGDLDISCNIKTFEGRLTAEALDTTTVCSTGWKEFIGGQRSWMFNASGLTDFADNGLDEKLNVGGSVGSTLAPITICPQGGADGALAFSGQALQHEFSTFGETGQLGPFSLAAVGKGHPLVRGNVMHPTTSARTASGNGSGLQLGALSASQSIFLGLHVTAISGSPTFAVILESDNNSNFTSATTRITSANYSAATGAEWQRLAGAVTDDYWRVRWTVSGGSSPSISFLAFVGIATY